VSVHLQAGASVGIAACGSLEGDATTVSSSISCFHCMVIIQWKYKHGGMSAPRWVRISEVVFQFFPTKPHAHAHASV